MCSGLLNLITIVMITVDTVGVMTLWGIDYNAVALINLVTVRTFLLQADLFAIVDKVKLSDLPGVITAAENMIIKR